jgi:poly-gamma-glutamate capsule biosynthesis protein CapA/YwtB (metallophosphatase superfamily)
METFGAGENLSAATRPLLLETPRGVVAVVSIGEDFGSSSRATLETPGMVVMSREMLEAQYNVARSAGADWVVAYVHWGTNYGDVDESQLYWAGQFAEAGYDLVVGTGSHTAQPIAFIGSMPVLYGIGNLAFTSNGRYADFGLPGHGLLATLELPAEGEPYLALTCLDVDNATVHFQARPCAAADARQTLTALNPLVQVQGGQGYLPVDRFASHS